MTITVFFSLWVVSPLVAEDVSSDATKIFRTYKHLLVQIRINERKSGSKSVIGSGFFVKPNGYLITNYHVVSDLIFQPDRYSAELRTKDNRRADLKVLAVDVVNDLALAKAEISNEEYFQIGEHALEQGEKVYALGNPRDLGFLVVEGTYNGLMDKTMYRRINYTGSINAGMSGGPAVTDSGLVVGVNVRSMGEQLAFLVPAEFVRALIKRDEKKKEEEKHDLKKEVISQFTANQQRYIDELLASSSKKVEMAEFSAPGELSPVFKCWSGFHGEDHDLYRSTTHWCSINDRLFASRDTSVGRISAYNILVENEGLNVFQFAKLYAWYYSSRYTDGGGGSENALTNYRCRSDYIETNGVPVESVLCVRAHKKLDGLYDMMLRSVVVSSSERGFVSQAVLTGISFDNILRFSRRFIEDLTWKQ